MLLSPFTSVLLTERRKKLTETEKSLLLTITAFLNGGFILFDKMDASAKIENKNEERREKYWFNLSEQIPIN